MTWELYEVWAEDESGHEELIETTRSLKEAQTIAEKTLQDGYITSIVYKETNEGDLEELERYVLD